MTQADRRTRGFLFADLRGYTAFVEAHGDTAAAALLSEYRDLVRETVARFAGAEIKTEGDSFYVAFDAASGAVECGLALVDAAAAASRDHPERPIRVGVGIHAGETIEMDGGYVGSAVNVAARVCSVARAGEVAISETVQGLVRTGLPVHFVLRGTPKLKGIEQPIAIYAVKHGPAPTISAWRKVAARRGGPGVGLLAAAVVVAIVGSLGGVVLFAGGLTAPGASGPPNAGAIASQSQPILSSPVAPNSQAPPGSVDPGGQGVTVLTLENQVMSDELDPGVRYEMALTRPRTRFTVPGPGWYADRDYVNGFNLAHEEVDVASGESAFPDYFAFGVVQVVFEGPCSDSPTRAIQQTPAALVEFLSSHSTIDATDPVPVNFGQYSGLSTDLTIEAAPPEGTCPIPDDMPEAVSKRFKQRTYMFLFGEDVFHISPDELIKVVAVNVEGRLVVLMFGTVERARWPQISPVSEKLLGSVEFVP